MSSEKIYPIPEGKPLWAVADIKDRNVIEIRLLSPQTHKELKSIELPKIILPTLVEILTQIYSDSEK